MSQESYFNIDGLHFATGKPVRLEIRDGIISSVTGLQSSAGSLDLPYIAPGLIDNQINGYANVDFSGSDLTPDAFIHAAHEIWKTGVTTFLPTLITSSHESLLKNFRILSKALGEDALVAGAVPGFHLEGPYISPLEGYRGCHPVQHVRKPDWSEFTQYQEACGGRIILVTIAPELEGSDEFIRLCRKDGILVSIGHTGAGAEIIGAAADSGVTLSTHLGNGCANMIHRHYNPIWPQLADERLTSTIIADGIHLLPEELKVFLKVKGASGIILISDVMYLAGMAPGKYMLMESEVMLTPEGMLKNIAMNCLAGASFPLKAGVGNMMKFTGCSLKDAINMASSNIAGLYPFNDRGVLARNKRADLILFDFEDYKLRIRNTYVNGQMVYQS